MLPCGVQDRMVRFLNLPTDLLHRAFDGILMETAEAMRRGMQGIMDKGSGWVV